MASTNAERLATVRHHLDRALGELQRASTAPPWAAEMLFALGYLHDAVAYQPAEMADALAQVFDEDEDETNG